MFAGGCLCGAVRFQVTPPTKWCANCHCSMCRRAHGAAFVTWVGVLVPQFEITAGRDRLTRYRSSEVATRSFCSACGSTLFFESTRGGQAHAFSEDHARWYPITDKLPRLGGKTGTEPLS